MKAMQSQSYTLLVMFTAKFMGAKNYRVKPRRSSFTHLTATIYFWGFQVLGQFMALRLGLIKNVSVQASWVS